MTVCFKLPGYTAAHTLVMKQMLMQRFYAWSGEKEKFTEKQVKRVFRRMKDIGLLPKHFQDLRQF